MLVKVVRGILCASIVALTCTSCKLEITNSYTAANPSAVPGTYTANYMAHYVTQENNLIDPGGPQDAINALHSHLQSSGWTEMGSDFDQNVTAQSILSASYNSDAYFFAGHGDVGVIALYYLNFWGVGAHDGHAVAPPIGTLGTRLRWMFFESSDTVAPDFIFDNAYGESAWQANLWENLFANSSVHGVYGYWQSPGSCAASLQYPHRDCDVYEESNQGVATSLVQFLVAGAGHTPETTHDAWAHANFDNEINNGISMIEDCSNTRDTLTGPGGLYQINNNPSGNLCWTHTQSGPINQSTVPVSAVTFTLNPVSLQGENLDIAGAMSRAQQYLGQPINQQSSPAGVTYFTTGGAQVQSYSLASGAITYHGAMQEAALPFDQQTALDSASDYVNVTFGMPGDAVLALVTGIYQTDKASGSTRLTGYHFVWRHSGTQILGADRIAVDVDDYQTWQSDGTCLDWEFTDPDPPAKPVHFCGEYEQVEVDHPNISYSYRLWRSPAGSVRVQLAGLTSGQQSIDAQTASLSLPQGSAIIAYSSGYWDGGLYSTAAVAQPAWLFTLGSGEVIAVDAFSGAVLGSTH